MRQKKVPMRMCSGCMEMKPKKELIRVVKAPKKPDENGKTKEADISLDLTGKKAGRGAYLCKDTECLKKAQKARRFEKAFSCKIPEDVFESMAKALEESSHEKGESENE